MQKCKEFLMKCGSVREETKKKRLAVLIVAGREYPANGRQGLRVNRRGAKCFCDMDARLDARQHY